MPVWNPVLFSQASAVGTASSPTTTSAPFVVIPQMTVTIPVVRGTVLVEFTCAFELQNGDDFNFAIFVDSVEEPSSRRRVNVVGTAPLLGTAPAIPGLPGGVHKRITGLAAGSRVVDVRWSVTAGTARAILLARSLSAIEVP